MAKANAIVAGAKSWKTTVLGLVLGLLTAGPDIVNQATGDGGEVDPVRLVTAAVFVVLGLIMRDADTSSQDSGVRE